MKNIIVILICLLASFRNIAQDTSSTIILAPSPKLSVASNGILFKLDQEGNNFLKMNIWTQIWFRAIENNPGTAVNKNPEKWTLDAGFRRMRIQMFGQVSPRFTLMLQMGANNQSFATGGGNGTGANGAGKRAPFYFHDAYGQFNIIPEKDLLTKQTNNYTLSIGTGLHSWNGVSRLTNASTISLLTADAPIFNWPTIEISDQLTRMFGVFAKGNLGKVGYRVSINKPFMTSALPTVGGPAVDNNKGNLLAYNGYFNYQFFEKDENTTAFLAGSYYGKKKVFNIGAGFLYSPNSTMTQPTAGVFESHAIAAFGADIYIDLPIGNKKKDFSLTFYSVFYKYNFGKDYIRTTAVMNPGTMDTTFTGMKALEGFGSARNLLGTGNMWYTQAGFMLPKFSEKIRLQPYFAYTWKDLQALNQPGHYYNLGVNLLFLGNNAKISIEYNSRTLYTTSTKTVFKRAGEILTVLQFWL